MIDDECFPLFVLHAAADSNISPDEILSRWEAIKAGTVDDFLVRELQKHYDAVRAFEKSKKVKVVDGKLIWGFRFG